MVSVQFRFYAELNDFLPGPWRQVDFRFEAPDGATVGDAVRLTGVPPDRVELLLANGLSVGLDYALRPDDRISVYPVFDAMDVGSVTLIERRPERRSGFVLDVHLGKLAHHLRMVGFDTWYRNSATQDELIALAQSEDRILLSKSRLLVSHPRLLASYAVRSSDPREQFLEVLRRFDIVSLFRPFTRCLHCNAIVRPAQEDEVAGGVPLRSRALYRDFTLCPDCRRVYWEGTHVGRMRAFLDGVLRDLTAWRGGSDLT